MTEREFQDAVIEMAHLLGWKVAHFRPAQTSKGWRTPVEADGTGFPDLVLARDRLVFLELKTETGRVSPDQAGWIAAINAAGGTALVVRPSDMGEIEKALRRRVDREVAGVEIHGPIVVKGDPAEFRKRLEQVAKGKKDEAA